MAEVLVTIEYKNADGKKQYLSSVAQDVDAEKLEEEISAGADVLQEYGTCQETEPGHYVLIPAHAIHRVDFELIQKEETDK
ncbi:hypothetical protein ACIBAH_35050 [Streptomyces sp. NPDC051445]|uniref:hypothetical protein n=1 Tax=Streptomyces sp. NPDC051445 TaxID=3365653 RepID=UPI0037ABD847